MAYWAALFLVLIVGFAIELVTGRKWWRYVLTSLAAAILFAGVVAGDFYFRTVDSEVWSGRVIDVEHIEEWDEWIPGKEECSTDDDGRKRCTKKPGHTEHHKEINKIKTSDNGWFEVNESMDGRTTFTSRSPNSTRELAQYYPLGTPSASVHHYVNKVRSSYSLFKHNDIDLKDYSGLPTYPRFVSEVLHVDRIVGNVPNKPKALATLAAWNTELNREVPDPEQPGETKSWKQVNLIFVNMGTDLPQEYGFALQDKWENGNKNDFIVSFSPALDGSMKWVYAFSWSEVDMLKLEVQDYMMEQGYGKDFVPIVDHVAQMVADQFVRKQFADFDYLQIEVSDTSIYIIWGLEMALLALYSYKSIRGFLRRRGKMTLYS
ncbi:hypothetical protein [Paenibacillus oryzisoli]|uniref:Uncharacterized protein n=1 Tax=Paenibacillus oryzisoli TaxID=1850517 RepID=A0A198A3B2_9BACL|nr:hypothetical protein [Paenibacillus oryzisoli]OAS15521.1 hypothetical protein A8708_13980 [Paenibacillus oryzisoli]